MKTNPLLLIVLLLCSSMSWAQEQGRVISSTPVVVQGSVPAQTAYNVVYEYAGQQYSVQFPYDPGPYVSLQISPVVQVPQPVTVANPVMVSPYPGPYYYGPPPFSFNFGFGYYRHFRR